MLKNKKAFTLIELIIVMAIIGILAVVAVVAISSKAGDARDARRRSDLSAIQTAFALYTSDDYGTTAVNTVITDPILVNVIDTDPGDYMDMSNVVDPKTGANRVRTCISILTNQECRQEGGYTFLSVVGESNIGTFSNYKIAAVLEDTADYLYLTQNGITFDDN